MVSSDNTGGNDTDVAQHAFGCRTRTARRALAFELLVDDVPVEIEEGEVAQFAANCLGTVSYTHLDVYKRQLFQSAFWQNNRNSLFLNVYFDGIGDLESDEAVADASDSAGYAAASDHFIALGECFDQGLVLLGSCLLYTSRCV